MTKADERASERHNCTQSRVIISLGSQLVGKRSSQRKSSLRGSEGFELESLQTIVLLRLRTIRRRASSKLDPLEPLEPLGLAIFWRPQ